MVWRGDGERRAPQGIDARRTVGPCDGRCLRPVDLRARQRARAICVLDADDELARLLRRRGRDERQARSAAAASDQRTTLAPVNATRDAGAAGVVAGVAAVVTVNDPLTVAVPAAVGPVAESVLLPT